MCMVCGELQFNGKQGNGSSYAYTMGEHGQGVTVSSELRMLRRCCSYDYTGRPSKSTAQGLPIHAASLGLLVVSWC